MVSLKDLATDLYTQLEYVGTEHEELTDTDVREALHVALNHYFVWAKPLDRLPINYAMFSAAGDALVAEAVNRFLHDAVPVAEAADIPVGQARLDVLQDRSIRTPGGNEYDVYIGFSKRPLPPDPIWEGRFQVANYERE